MYPLHGACTNCGCSLAECECPERAEPDIIDKIDRYFITMEKPKDVFRCFDCLGRVPGYMVLDKVWDRAWPHSTLHRKVMERRVEEARLTPTMSVWAGLNRKKLVFQGLCFICIQDRLGRALVIEDFTGLPINAGIRLGFQMGLATTVKSPLLSTEPPARG